MVSAHDVAAYILNKTGLITAMKLQKLIYYSQAWSLVWDEKPLFKERVEAWANGPVVRELYDTHRGRFEVDDWPSGNPDKLGRKQRATVDSVLAFYGSKSGQWLSELTHSEAPWIEARKDIPDGQRGHSEISLAALAEYYGSL
ncbi:MAG: type II toxin-antitoxin system antitoxin SocA domain-containing protein [Bacteroidota bacterium]